MSSSSLSECLICQALHDYDTKCHPAHSSSLCRDCWTAHVEKELSLSPYLGCRCPFCRQDIDNDVFQALKPRQVELQDARRQADRESQDWRGTVASGGAPGEERWEDHTYRANAPMEFRQVDIPTGRRWRGGQRSNKIRGFETRKERAQRRAEQDRRLAEITQRAERARRETEEWQAAKRKEEEGQPVNYNLVSCYDEIDDDENYY